MGQPTVEQAVRELCISTLPRVTECGVIFKSLPRDHEGRYVVQVEGPRSMSNITFDYDGAVLPSIRKFLSPDVLGYLKKLPDAGLYLPYDGPDWIPSSALRS